MDQKVQTGPQDLGSDIKKLKDALVANDGSGKIWQEGWYVYQEGKIQGPLGLMESLSRPYFGADQQSVLISRRGYHQWYELSLLAPLLDPVAGIRTAGTGKNANAQPKIDQDRTRSSPENFTKFNVVAADIFESRNSPVSTLNKDQKESKEGLISESRKAEGTHKKIFQTMKHPSIGPSLVKPVLPDSQRIESTFHSYLDDGIPASQTAADLAYKDFKPAVEASHKVPMTLKSKKLSKGSDSAKEQPARWIPPKGEPTKGEVIQEYFISRKKLRLGAIRSLALYGWVGFLGTGGLIWGLWMAQTVKEIQLHCFGKSETPRYLFAFSMIPMIHFFYIYFLAKQIVGMEKQNRYQTVSITLAVLFGFFPPICISYLQKAVNNHWLLHAKSALIKQG